MFVGYGDGLRNQPPPAITSRAYDHGRRHGLIDRAQTLDFKPAVVAGRRSET